MSYIKYQQLVAKGDGRLQNLRAQLDNLKTEGRSKDWTQKQTQAATAATRKELEALQGERWLQCTVDKAKAREITRPGTYQERSYHVQKAAAMAQGLKGEQLTKLFEDITEDHEAKEHWREYADVIRPRLDPELNVTLEEASQKLLTPEERDQQNELAALKVLDSHLQMIAGLEDMAVEDLAKGQQPAMTTNEAFDACLEQVKRVREGESYKADIEKSLEKKLAGAE